MTKKLFCLCIAFLMVLCGCTPSDKELSSTESEKSSEISSSEKSSEATEDEEGSETPSNNNELSENESKNEDSSEDNTKNDSEELFAEQLLAKMTLDEKIGQMLMLSIRSWEKSPVTTTIPASLENVINKYSVGNIILFAENFSSVEDTVKLTHSLQEALDSDIPMFISADQEGGYIVRLSTGCSLTGNMALGATGEESDSFLSGQINGSQLSALGVNVALAPALDINNNPENPVINVRSFSENASLVGKLGAAMIRGMQTQNISACAKHFPGHGDTVVDSHFGLPSIDKTYEEIKNRELIPFKSAIESGVDMIMTAHIQFPKIETEKKNGLILPATLSKTFLTDILKGDMGFEGIIMTDSMLMDAIDSYFTMEEACITAINAGIDIILMPINFSKEKDAKSLENLINAIKNAVSSGEISEERINDAVKRILKVKRERKLFESLEKTLDEKISNALETVGCEEHKKAERDLAAKSVTVLENESVNLFKGLSEGKSIAFFVPSESVKTNVEFALDRLISEKSIDITYKIKEYGVFSSIGIDKFDAVVILTDTSASWDVNSPLNIYNKSIENNIPTAVISCRLPYDTALFTNADCLLACYCPKGGSPKNEKSAFGVNISGAIEVLFGVSEGKGKLPVTVYSVSQKGKYDFSNVVYPFGYSA